MRNKYSVLLVALLTLSSILFTYKFTQYSSLIGDQAWFYLSAKDMLTKGEVPLVGITSSQTWLHQGAYWTYILALFFFLWGFHPVVPVVLSVLIGIATSYVLWKVCVQLFNKNTAVIALTIFAFSPFVQNFYRMPYHTTLIPFCMTLYIYALVKIRKHPYLPFLLTGILYNFHILSVVLYIPALIILLITHREKKIIKKEVFLKIIIFGFIPFIPILIYDINHGMNQTIKFPIWLILKTGSLLLTVVSIESGKTWEYIMDFYTKLLFIKFPIASIVLVTMSTLFYGYKTIVEKQLKSPITILFGIFVYLSLVVFGSGVNSEAYLSLLIIPNIIIVSLAISYIFSHYNIHKSLLFILLGIYIAFNTMDIVGNDFYISKKSLLTEKMKTVNMILSDTAGKEYAVIQENNIYESFYAPYNYIGWWLGNEPKQNSKKIYVVEESEQGIKVEKYNQE